MTVQSDALLTEMRITIAVSGVGRISGLFTDKRLYTYKRCKYTYNIY